MFNDAEWYDGAVTFKPDRPDGEFRTVSALVRVDLPGGMLYSTSHGVTLMAPWSDVVEVQIDLSPSLKTVDNQGTHAGA